MPRVIVLDDQPERAEFVRALMEKQIEVELSEVTSVVYDSVRGATALVHWSLLNRAYTELAQLRGKVQMLFYSLCADKRVRGRVHLLPDELDVLLTRILELQRS